MSAIGDRLDSATRARLLARLDELRAVDRLMREPGRQRPPEPPPALADITSQDVRPDPGGSKEGTP